MAKKVSAILIGAGQRGAQVYGEYALSHPKDIAFIAVAEPDDARRAEFCLQHGILPNTTGTLCWSAPNLPTAFLSAHRIINIFCPLLLRWKRDTMSFWRNQ